MAAATLGRHAGFQTNAYDLGFFDQIIWNTSQGRFFETSFVKYNFLGQHFDPVLLAFAALYRLGAGVESLVVTASVMASLAALPLYVAAKRFSDSSVAGVLCAGAFLLSAPLHEAVNFDFHPETMIFVFVFTAAAFLAYDRPRAAVVSLLPLLLIKEDMALVLIAISLPIALRGHRREALRLATIGGVWFVATVLLVMPALRGGGGSDLTKRYMYLVEDTTPVSAAPTVAERATTHLAEETAPGAARLLLSTGGLPLISPPALIAAAPLAVLSGLADHPEQAGLRLHYAMPTLALLWLAALLSLDWLRRRDRRLPVAASGLLVLCAVVTFLMSSPFAAGQSYNALPAQGEAALHEALAMVPDSASVQAQSTILPHVSQRRDVFEFPDKRRAEYVILASGLPRSSQSLAKGYDAQHAALPDNGYERVFQDHGVEVWRFVR